MKVTLSDTEIKKIVIDHILSNFPQATNIVWDVNLIQGDRHEISTHVIGVGFNIETKKTTGVSFRER